MSKPAISPLLRAWYKWKMLRLPWRRQFLVGTNPPSQPTLNQTPATTNPLSPTSFIALVINPSTPSLNTQAST
jgi:hypothetical protein